MDRDLDGRERKKTTTRIEAERVRRPNDGEPRAKGQCVLYWRQQSQRAEHNPALEYAVQQANERGGPGGGRRGRPRRRGHRYLEELVVRRELAQNFCAFEPDYDRSTTGISSTGGTPTATPTSPGSSATTTGPGPGRYVCGTVRCMSASGLERKCDIEACVDKVRRLVDEVEAARAGEEA